MTENNVTNLEIFNNFILISNTIRIFVKSTSKNNDEAIVKAKVFNKINSSIHNWGMLGQLSSFLFLTRYLLKSNRGPVLKITLVFSYIYTNQHFFHLPSYLGILFNLKWAVNQLSIGEGETANNTRELLNIIRTNQENKISDSKLMEYFFKKINNSPELEQAFSRQLTTNNYFSKNYEKYVKKNDDDPQYKVFSPYDENHQENQLKLKYFDCFLSRYFYHSLYRWTLRMKGLFGIIKN